MAQLVLREDRGGLATLILNRPEKLNSLSTELVVELRSQIEQIAQQTQEVGLVVIRGAGKGFCAGADIAEIMQRPPKRLPEPNFTAKTIEMLGLLPQPVICAVHGVCYTGGLEMALACDMIVAAESARFADTHAKWGIVAIWGMTQRLPRRIGTAKAMEMMTTARPFTGAEAVAMGLANFCFPDEVFDQRLREFTDTILANSWHTLRANKRLMRETDGMLLAAGLAHESYRHPGNAPDMRERLSGFGAKAPKS